MQNNLLCYTGGATGLLNIDDCSCNTADMLATTGYKSLEDFVDDHTADFETLDLPKEELEDEIDKLLAKFFNAGTTACSKLTHTPIPESVWPTRDAFDAAIESGNASTRLSQIISVVGRQCFSPQVGITAEQRSRPQPAMLPWEYRFTDSGASACTCAAPLEPRSVSMSEMSPLATNYFLRLESLGYSRPDRSLGRSSTSPKHGNPIDSCLFFRKGFSLSNADLNLSSPVIQGSSRSVNLTLDASSASVPLFPGADPDDTLTCGAESLMELSQFCYFGLELDFQTSFVPNQQHIETLSSVCADPGGAPSIRQRCCHLVEATPQGGGEQTFRTMIRLDLVRALPPRPVGPADNNPAALSADAVDAVPSRQRGHQQRRRPVPFVPARAVGVARDDYRQGNQPDARPTAVDHGANSEERRRERLSRDVSSSRGGCAELPKADHRRCVARGQGRNPGQEPERADNVPHSRHVGRHWRENFAG